MTITDDDLARLEALAQAATPGPWEACGPWPRATVYGPPHPDYGPQLVADCGEVGRDERCDLHPDSAFIAAACEAVPELVAEVRRQRLIISSIRLANAAVVEVQQANLAERDAYSNELFTVREENDALRADNERLRAELAEEKRRLLADDERRLRIRAHLAVEREAAELRASLADAVGRMGRMERIVDMARDYIGFCFGPRAGREPFGRDDRRARLRAAVVEYEASLPGIAKVES